MPFCPNCRTEYDEGFHVCADCGTPLVEKLPAEAMEEPRVSYGDPMNRTFLVTVMDPVQSAMLIDVLNQNGIPAFAQPREAGGYLKASGGYSVFGEDIYVDEADLDAAAELAEGIVSPQADAFDEAAEKEESEPVPNRAKKRARIIAAVCIVACVAVLVVFGIVGAFQ